MNPVFSIYTKYFIVPSCASKYLYDFLLIPIKITIFAKTTAYCAGARPYGLLDMRQCHVWLVGIMPVHHAVKP